MIGRVIRGTMLAAAVLASTSGVTPANAAGPAVTREASPATSASPIARVKAAVERAASLQIPGTRGRGWVLHQLDQSEPRADGSRRIVARGVIGTPGDPGTHVKMVGLYDPAAGVLRWVSYELKAPAQSPPARDADLAPAWSVQSAVQQALAEATRDPSARFALDSAQSLRLEDGGRRFDGVGIGHLRGGEATFVSFTLQLSPDGETIAFDYGLQEQLADSGAALAAEY